MLIFLFLALHNPALSPSWFLGRNYVTVFRAPFKGVQELEAKEACGGSEGCSGDDYFLVLLAVCWDASKALEQCLQIWSATKSLFISALPLRLDLYSYNDIIKLEPLDTLYHKKGG